MKIRIEDCHGLKIALETPDDKGLTNIADIAERMRNIITFMSASDVKNDNTCANEPELAIKAMTPVVTPERDTHIIRPRIPNNIVDIKDLTIENAVTENALVRCPHCGQAHALAVTSNNRIYMMRRNYAKNEFGIIVDFESLDSKAFMNMCCKPETNRKLYFEDLQKMTFMTDTDFAVTNETEVFCPVCCQSSTFIEWKEAYENPLQFFETEHLCDACGGEKVEKLIKNHKVYQCDACGLQSDFKEE